MSFRFRKLYADLVTDDGAVCVVYLAWLEAWSVRTAFAGVELYGPSGRREVLRAASPPPNVAIEPRQGGLEIRLDLRGGPFVLAYSGSGSPWAPCGLGPAPGLHWRGVVPRADAVARWPGDPSRHCLRGTGYADWVELRRTPRRLDLSLVEWGRVHLPAETLVFTGVSLRRGGGWRRLLTWSGDAPTPREYTNFRLRRLGNTTRPDVRFDLELPFAAREGVRHLTLEPRRRIHRGPALDGARFPALSERLGTRLLVGRIRETRYLSRAVAQPGRGGAPAWALHEWVRFG